MSMLFLLRHATAAQARPGMKDIERPLAPRGLCEAEAIGREMRGRGYVPDLVLCSTARRTRETCEAAGYGASGGLVLVELYGRDAAFYLSAIRTASKTAASVLLIGHNPSVESLASTLAGGGEEVARRRLASGVPPAALAVLSFRVALSEIASGDGYLEVFLAPSAL